MTDIKIGCDPEFFLWDKQLERWHCAHDMVPGTKEEPFKVEKGAVQVDGFALEFNIDPVTNADDFVTNITTVLAQMRRMVPDRFEFKFVPHVYFDKKYFEEQPEKAKELGCTPDFNAYTSEENPVPVPEKSPKGVLRTASGHIHIGFTEGAKISDPAHLIKAETLVKQLDAVLAIPTNLWEVDGLVRRTLYGAAGAYRPKSYGVEYRTLSNRWLTSEERMRFVFEQTLYAIETLKKGLRPEHFMKRGYEHSTPILVNRYTKGITSYHKEKDLFDKAAAI